MRQAATDADFLAAPMGACLAAPSFLTFCASADLWGFAVWGRPEAAEITRLVRLLRAELAPSVARHASLVDARRLEAVDAAAFAALSAYVSSEHAALGRAVSRLALVRPEGLAGAAVAGFFSVLAPPYPVEVFADPVAALAWLGQPAGALVETLDAAHARVAGLAPALVELRRLLDARPGALTLEDAARALGVSARSLQRRLKDAGATFQAEVADAQVRAAKRLLLDSTAALTEIALEVGCASLQAFSDLFRRRVGEAPSAWRARHKDALP